MTASGDLLEELVGAGDGAAHAELAVGQHQLGAQQLSILRRSTDMDSGITRISR